MQASDRGIQPGWQARWHGKRASLGSTRDAAGMRPRCWGQIGSSDSLPWRLEKTAASPCVAQRCHLRLVQNRQLPQQPRSADVWQIWGEPHETGLNERA